MFAFFGHRSAVEALRFISTHKKLAEKMSPWPAKTRKLPNPEHLVSTQRAFQGFAASHDLEGLGVVSTPVDLLVPAGNAFSRGAQARFHVWSRRVPEDSMLRASKDIVISGPEMVILQLCAAQSKLEPLLDPAAEEYWAERDLLHELGIDKKPALELPVKWERDRRLVAAAALACEFAGTYRLPGGGGGKASYKLKPLMSCESLRQHALGFRKTSAETRALRVADLAFDGSASPMETALALLLTLPVEFGGLGLPRPLLNKAVDVSDYRGIISDRDEVSPDMLWEEAKVAVEYDSAEKHGSAGPKQLAEDALRSNILTSLGYRVVRVTPQVISSIPSLEMLARQIAHLLGVELQEPDDIQVKRRNKLFVELMPKRE